jgi:hypothetical protein
VLSSVTRLAAVLQTLLTTRADEVAREVGLVRRRRVLTGAAWVQTLVLGWLERPQASLEDLADGVGPGRPPITPQGLDRWFRPEGAECLRRLTQEAVGTLIETEAAALPLLGRFEGVYVEDCTTAALPAGLSEDYAGCGGNDPGGRDRAALKIFVRQEVTGGAVTEVALGPGRRPDVRAGQQAGPLPAGALRLKDLGFFDTRLMGRDSASGVHRISRLPSSVRLRCGDGPAEGLAEFLRRRRADAADERVRVGTEQPLEARLLAVRCPEAVRQKRLRKLAERVGKKGRVASDRQRELCGWTVLLTDLPADRLSVEEAWVLYRVRWQIELLFKLWKGAGRLDKSRGRRGGRVLCEVLAKLLGMLVQHWLLLTGGPWLDGASRTRKVGVVRRFLAELAAALAGAWGLADVLHRIAERLRRLRPRNRRLTKPLTIDLIKEPSRARLGLS